VTWLRLMHNWLNAASKADEPDYVVIGDPDGAHVRLDLPADAIGATVYRGSTPKVPGVFYPAQRDGEPA
jgi:hypothetical protein